MARYASNPTTSGGHFGGVIGSAEGRPVTGIFGTGQVRFFPPGTYALKAPAIEVRVRMWSPAGTVATIDPTGLWSGSFCMGVVTGLVRNSNIPIVVQAGRNLNTNIGGMGPLFTEFGPYMKLTTGPVGPTGTVTPDVYNQGEAFGGGSTGNLSDRGAPGCASLFGRPGSGGAGYGGLYSTASRSRTVFPTPGFTGLEAYLDGILQTDSGQTLRQQGSAPTPGMSGIDYIGTGGGGYSAGTNGSGGMSAGGFPGGQAVTPDSNETAVMGGRPGGGLIIIEW